MKSIRVDGADNLQTLKIPIPAPGIGKKLTRAKSVGIFGSSLHWFSEVRIGCAQLEPPLILGHESAGETANGQRAAIDQAISHAVNSV